jgi:hypothetical protein
VKYEGIRYGIEVLIEERTPAGKPAKVWRRVRPTGGKPYVFGTLMDASKMRAMCYPDQLSTEVRIVEVSDDDDHDQN